MYKQLCVYFTINLHHFQASVLILLLEQQSRQQIKRQVNRVRTMSNTVMSTGTQLDER